MKLSLSCKLPTHSSGFCLGYSVSKNRAIHLVKWKTMIEMRFTAQLWEIIKMRGRLFKPPTGSREAAKGLPWLGRWLPCAGHLGAPVLLPRGWGRPGRSGEGRNGVVRAPWGSSGWIDIHQAASVVYLQLQYCSSWPYKNELINKHLHKGRFPLGRAMCLLALCGAAGLKGGLGSVGVCEGSEEQSGRLGSARTIYVLSELTGHRLSPCSELLLDMQQPQHILHLLNGAK